jgi:hypothetical protein
MFIGVMLYFIYYGFHGGGVLRQLKALADVIAKSGVVKDVRVVRLDVVSSLSLIELILFDPCLPDQYYAFIACAHTSPLMSRTI